MKNKTFLAVMFFAAFPLGFALAQVTFSKPQFAWTQITIDAPGDGGTIQASIRMPVQSPSGRQIIESVGCNPSDLTGAQKTACAACIGAFRSCHATKTSYAEP